MNINQANDFIRHIIPWVMEKAQLKRNKMPLPQIRILDDVEAFIRKTGTEASYNHEHQPEELQGLLETRAAYSPDINTMLLSTIDEPTKFEDINRVYRESVMVHELTHYLQAANDMLTQETIPECECMAYTVQALYLSMNGVNPEPFNLMPEDIMIVSGMAEKLQRKQQKRRAPCEDFSSTSEQSFCEKASVK